jgi:hypothetical protein
MCFHGPTGPTSRQKKTSPIGPSRIEEKRNEKRDIPVKNWISRLKMGYRKYERKNTVPFSIPLLVHSVPFSVPFPFIPEKTKTNRKKRYTVADEMGFISSVFILGSACECTLFSSWVVAAGGDILVYPL